jgi:molecular chaperone Hsp33
MNEVIKMDRIMAITLDDFKVRAYFADMSQTVETMNQIHDTTPSAAAAAGRTLIATAIMGAMMKNETDSVTTVLKSESEIKQIIAFSNYKAQVRCDIVNPLTSVGFNEKRKIDVKAVVGTNGTLTVIRDLGLDRPYVGMCELVSGEIAEDFTYYFAKSEQIPSSVALGVFVTKDLKVDFAGGYIIQLLPDCEENVIVYLEDKLKDIPSVTKMLMDGFSLEDMANEVFGGLGTYKIIHELVPEYKCNCSRERMEKLLISLGEAELASIVSDGEDIEVVCHYCNTKYNFEIDEVKTLLTKALS